MWLHSSLLFGFDFEAFEIYLGVLLGTYLFEVFFELVVSTYSFGFGAIVMRPSTFGAIAM